MRPMRKTITAALSALALAIPAADGVAAVRSSAATAAKKKVVVTRKVVGSAVEADRWGTVQVTLVVRKTTVTSGTKKTVTRKIVGVTSTAPDHTPRSAYISSQAIPMLRQQALARSSAATSS